MELLKNSLIEQISDVKSKITDTDKQFDEYQKLSDGILELKFAQSDLDKKANEELVNKKKELQTQIDEKNDYLLNISNGIQRNNREISGYEYDIKSVEKIRNELAEQWKLVNAEVFDESTTICPTCHRELPADEIERLRSAFEKSKADRLEDIEKKGTKCKQDIENTNALISRLQECNKDNLANKEKLEKEVVELEKQLSELPRCIDVSDTDEFKALEKQINEKELALSKLNNTDDARLKLKTELTNLRFELTECEKKIAKAENNIKIDERIEELRAEQREVAQKIADVEKMLYLLDEFIKYKLDKISDSINAMFDGVNWKLFSEQINGGVKEVCEVTYNGVPFQSLNSGHRIVAGLKIIKALQELYNVYPCVFVDNAESVNDFNLPDMKCQMILLSVTEDRELRVQVKK